MRYQKQIGGKMTLLAVIRLRSAAKKSTQVNYALKIMGLTRVNHCVIVKLDDVMKGQLDKVKDYVTYGEIDDATLKAMVKKRGRLEGHKRLTPEFFKEKKVTLEKVVEMYKEPKKVYELGIKKVFRLSPASKGLKSIKATFRQKGDLGPRGKEINTLLNKMI
ncbi:MAG: 50S ribosomal protein L30 [Candidatus Diapherotrites archaeon CG09_land_8_20_14_0_10_32_12]|nr:MAG: 50S ribosomal protein L30 [Candidatus Diapherotrites archaeon CG09_land_8_20_14_0_10_32_12]